MSYAIAPTFEANKIGVRRVYTLSGAGLRGAPDALALQMIADGYDISIITSLTDANVTDPQLQNLYDNYGAGTQEFAVAANQLLTQLTGGPGGATSAVSYPKGAIPTIQTDLMGTIDLSLRSTWDAVTSQFTTIGNQLNALAARNPNDPNIVQMRNQYNSLASQFASTWNSVFNSPSPVKTLGTWEDVAAASGLVILGGVAIASGVGIPLVAIVGSILAGLYVIAKGINAYNASTAVAAIAPSTGAGLTPTYQKQIDAANAAYAKGDKATGDALMAAANNTLATITKLTAPAVAPTQLTTWFTQNWVGVAAVLIGIAVLPGLIKKL